MADIEVTLVTGYDIQQASSTNIGGIKAEEKTDSETNEVKIDPETGKLYAADGGGSYVLPTASETTKGGVKVGEGLEMTGEAIGLDAATQESLGLASTALQEVPSTYRTAAQQDAIHDSTKVDVVSGKGLSANDYTTAEKTKLASVESGADVTDADNVAAAGALMFPSSGVAVGKYFRVASVDATTGAVTLEACDAPSGGVSDVQVGGTSVVSSGVANIPIAGSGGESQNIPKLGCVAIDYGTYGGICKTVSSDPSIVGFIRVKRAEPSQIAGRTQLRDTRATGTGDDTWDTGANGANACYPIVPGRLDTALRMAMTDGIGMTWTDSERLAALARMGCTVDSNGFVKWTAQSST